MGKINEEGFLTTEFHEVMNLFGPYLKFYNSNLPFTSMDVLIEEKNLEDYEYEKTL